MPNHYARQSQGCAVLVPAPNYTQPCYPSPYSQPTPYQSIQHPPCSSPYPSRVYQVPQVLNSYSPALPVAQCRPSVVHFPAPIAPQAPTPAVGALTDKKPSEYFRSNFDLTLRVNEMATTASTVDQLKSLHSFSDFKIQKEKDGDTEITFTVRSESALRIAHLTPEQSMVYGVPLEERSFTQAEADYHCKLSRDNSGGYRVSVRMKSTVDRICFAVGSESFLLNAETLHNPQSKPEKSPVPVEKPVQATGAISSPSLAPKPRDRQILQTLTLEVIGAVKSAGEPTRRTQEISLPEELAAVLSSETYKPLMLKLDIATTSIPPDFYISSSDLKAVIPVIETEKERNALRSLSSFLERENLHGFYIPESLRWAGANLTEEMSMQLDEVFYEVTSKGMFDEKHGVFCSHQQGQNHKDVSNFFSNETEGCKMLLIASYDSSTGDTDRLAFRKWPNSRTWVLVEGSLHQPLPFTDDVEPSSLNRSLSTEELTATANGNSEAKGFGEHLKQRLLHAGKEKSLMPGRY